MAKESKSARDTMEWTAGNVLEPGRSTPGPPHIIFIVGWGRSGSTLLGNILGELEGCVHVGEIHDLWSAYAGRLECGCGVPLSDCPFWKRVAAADSRVERALLSAPEVQETKRRHMRIRYVPRILKSFGSGEALSYPIEGYSHLVCRLFRAVATTAHARIVVDSTKSPAGAALLLGMPLQVSFIHLVRDPRATGFSWQRHTVADPAGIRRQTRIGYCRNAASWLYWNSVAELIRKRVTPDRWLRVRYEDFVATPEVILEQVAEQFGLSRNGWPLDGRGLQLGTHHTVEGNPSRFKTGRLKIVPDEEWSKNMPRVARAITVAIAAPLMRAYGY